MKTPAAILTFLVIAYASPAQADAPTDEMVAVHTADARHDYATEFKLLQSLADQGDASAQALFGGMYHQGKGVTKNYEEAVRWFLKAAEQGDTNAQDLLGLSYAQGQGVPKDDTEAARQFLKAAEQGDANAQGFLGGMYDKGEGVPKDYVQAYMWLNLAAAGGNNDAGKLRDAIEQLMTAEQIAEARQRSAAWQPARSEDQEITLDGTSLQAPIPAAPQDRGLLVTAATSSATEPAPIPTPACTEQDAEIARMAKQNGYLYNSACNLISEMPESAALRGIER